jgi:hypothetical protein
MGADAWAIPFARTKNGRPDVVGYDVACNQDKYPHGRPEEILSPSNGAPEMHADLAVQVEGMLGVGPKDCYMQSITTWPAPRIESGSSLSPGL